MIRMVCVSKAVCKHLYAICLGVVDVEVLVLFASALAFHLEGAAWMLRLSLRRQLISVVCFSYYQLKVCRACSYLLFGLRWRMHCLAYRKYNFMPVAVGHGGVLCPADYPRAFALQ